MSHAPAPASLPALLARALRLRCPRCGQGAVFARVLTYAEHERCPVCGLVYDERGESVVFMYLSTAFLTGLFIIGMLCIHPDSLFRGRVVLMASALTVYVSTLPLRKSIAIAVNYRFLGQR